MENTAALDCVLQGFGCPVDVELVANLLESRTDTILELCQQKPGVYGISSSLLRPMGTPRNHVQLISQPADYQVEYVLAVTRAPVIMSHERLEQNPHIAMNISIRITLARVNAVQRGKTIESTVPWDEHKHVP